MSKICRICQQEKPLGAFYQQRSCKDERRPECRACFNTARREYRNADLAHHQAAARRRYHVNPGKSRADRKAQYHKDREWGALRAQLGKYGLTLDQFHALQERQDFSCAICGDVAELQIDHSHTTKRVRGLLCAGCNLGIGHFGERASALAAAARYVAA
jgi:hypothetical protein